jgi:heme-degrading monooxygenase HmoA
MPTSGIMIVAIRLGSQSIQVNDNSKVVQHCFSTSELLILAQAQNDRIAEVSVHQENRAQKPAAAATNHLRVVFAIRVPEASQELFLLAYRQVSARVARVDGHLVDQLCQSLHDPAEWLITSEWETSEHFLAWERSEGHRQLAAPLVAHTTERKSLRYLVRGETISAP